MARSERSGDGNGGVPARRAVMRWAWRLFRREWRQQALVLALLTVAVAAAVGGAAAAYNTGGAPDDAVFGSANHFLTFDSAGRELLEDNVAAAEGFFGTVDVVVRREVGVPGSVERVEYRAQDPRGPYSAPMLALVEGAYPTTDGEVAVTDDLVSSFDLDVGSTFSLDGTDRRVVGVVENPSDLDDGFALLRPGADLDPDAVTVLVSGGTDQAESFAAVGGMRAPDVELGVRSGNEDVQAAANVLGAAAVALLLVALVATAGFVAVAQRRLRQLGMLAAIGATEKHLRLVMVTSGAIIGLVAALAGAVVGVAGWLAVGSGMDEAVGHRIDPWNIPWPLVVVAMALVVANATGAAWWPARAVARVPITRALSGRPPRPTPVRSAAGLALLSVVAGVGLLVLGRQNNALLIGVGTIAVVIGVLLVSPLAVRVLGVVAGRFPVAVRLALRDLARYQARSGVALAAISLALGIPAAVVIVATANEDTAEEGNLAAEQMLIRTGDPDDPTAACPGPVQAGSSGPCPYIPDRTESELQEQEDQLQRIIEPFADPSVTTLDVAYDPDLDRDADGRPAVALATPTGEDTGAGPGLLDVSLLYVADADALEQYGIPADDVDPGVEVLSVIEGEMFFTGLADGDGSTARPEPVSRSQPIEVRHTSLPGSFITPRALDDRGWEAARAGWLVDAGAPVSDEQFVEARTLAAEAGLIVEVRDEQEGLAALRTGATAAGVLLALGVLAMTVGLIRSEAASDLRTLTAAGATSSTRRMLTAATAGGLASLGVVLGIAGAYVGLGAGYLDEAGALVPVPVAHLLALGIGVPALAAAVGWLVAGREPDSLADRRFD